MTTNTQRSIAATGEEKLIGRWIEPESHRATPADVRLREYGVSVWALVGYWRVVSEDVDQVAADYDLPREAVEAALAYYRRHKDLIDARLLLNTA